MSEQLQETMPVGPSSTPRPETVQRMEAAVSRVAAGVGVKALGPLSFGQAVRATLEGKRVRRTSWPEKITHLFCSEAWLMVHKADGTDCQVLLQRADIEGEDWMVME